MASSVRPLYVDWRITPGEKTEPSLSSWLKAFSESFPKRSLVLDIQTPTALESQTLIELVELLSDCPNFSLHVSTYCDRPQKSFLRMARLLTKRLELTYRHEPDRVTDSILYERLAELREVGIEPAVLFRPRKEHIALLPRDVDMFSDWGFPVAVFPSLHYAWEEPSGPANLTVLYRFSADNVLRWLFAEPSVQGRLSRAGSDFVTVYPDGSVFPTPVGVRGVLGNVFTGHVHLWDAPRAYPAKTLGAPTMILALGDAACDYQGGNPISCLLEHGFVRVKQGKASYPYRDLEWEDDGLRASFGLPPLGHPVMERLADDALHAVYSAYSFGTDRLAASARAVPGARSLVRAARKLRS